MSTDLETLTTAQYVRIDDQTGGTRWPGRPLGRPPRLTDSELVCPAMAQALSGFHSKTRWPRFAHAHPTGMFPSLPQHPGSNKRPRAAPPWSSG